LEGTAANLVFIINITNSNFFGALHGIHYGPGIQGVTISGVNFTLNDIGLYVAPAAAGAAQAQLSIMNSQFDNYGDNILTDTGNTLSHLQVMNSLFYLVAGTAGIHTKLGGGDFSLIGNHFGPASGSGVLSATGIMLENEATNLASDNMCIDLAVCVQLQPTALGWSIRNTATNGNAGTQTVVNTSSPDAPNYITGFIDLNHLYFPNALTITGAASAGGLIELTIGGSTTLLTTGEIVLLNAPGLANQPQLYKIGSIPDSSHVILAGSAYGGSLTANGSLSVLP
jgi:hypothetical protein